MIENNKDAKDNEIEKFKLNNNEYDKETKKILDENLSKLEEIIEKNIFKLPKNFIDNINEIKKYYNQNNEKGILSFKDVIKKIYDIYYKTTLSIFKNILDKYQTIYYNQYKIKYENNKKEYEKLKNQNERYNPKYAHDPSKVIKEEIEKLKKEIELDEKKIKEYTDKDEKKKEEKKEELKKKEEELKKKVDELNANDIVIKKKEENEIIIADKTKIEYDEDVININNLFKEGAEEDKKKINYVYLNKQFEEKNQKILINLKQIRGDTQIENNPVKNTVKIANDIDTNIFTKLFNKYTDDINEGTKAKEIINDDFVNNIKSLDLDPSEQLEINLYDKIIFVCLMYILRLISLSIVSIFINNNKINNILTALNYYTIIYIIIYVIIVIIINLDSYKLRILFNYLNLHGNSTKIYSHVVVIIIFTYLLYYLISNINILNIDRRKISENDKLKLGYKLDILTTITFVFVSIIILLL